jgi:hypothetical protein
VSAGDNVRLDEEEPDAPGAEGAGYSPGPGPGNCIRRESERRGVVTPTWP